jgi:2-dehydropantoate 2-reductase
MWQSLARGTGTVEADWLNGEIVLLGRLVGYPTPINACLQRLAADLAASGSRPGTVSEDDILAAAGAPECPIPRGRRDANRPLT